MHKFTQPKLDIPFQSIRNVLDKYRRDHPNKIALYDLEQNRSVTWGTLAHAAEQIARYLISIGIKKGDRIGLLSDENLDKMIIWMGIWRIGAVVCPLNVEINSYLRTKISVACFCNRLAYHLHVYNKE